jgi:hypothetical protein
MSFLRRLESTRLLFPALCPLEAGSRPQLKGWGDRLNAHSLFLVSSHDVGHVQILLGSNCIILNFDAFAGKGVNTP